MTNIKELHHAGRLPASGVSQLDIEYHHNQWCRDNGYPVNSYKPQAGRPKRQASSVKRQASSTKVLERQAYIVKLLSNSVKRQAISFKLQAASSKLLDQ